MDMSVTRWWPIVRYTRHGNNADMLIDNGMNLNRRDISRNMNHARRDNWRRDAFLRVWVDGSDETSCVCIVPAHCNSDQTFRKKKQSNQTQSNLFR
jgi:hypothetical protein